MAFDETALEGVEAASFLDRTNFDLGRLVQTLVLAVVALAIAFGVLRPMMRSATPPVGSDAATPALAGLPPGASPALGAPRDDLPDTAQLASPQSDAAPAALAAGDPAQPEAAGLPGAEARPALPAAAQAIAPGDEALPDPVDRLRRLIEEREEETVEILRSWMEEDEEVQP